MVQFALVASEAPALIARSASYSDIVNYNTISHASSFLFFARRGCEPARAAGEKLFFFTGAAVRLIPSGVSSKNQGKLRQSANR
jgi:hypothetical protein